MTELRPLELPGDAAPLTEIYNHYVLHSTATFETVPLTVAQMTERLAASYFALTAVDSDGRVVGYGALHAYRPRFDRVAEATCYLAPEAVGEGLGARILDLLVDAARRRGDLTGVIACINETNLPSRRLVESRGFRRVGRYPDVAVKFSAPLTDLDYLLPLCL